MPFQYVALEDAIYHFTVHSSFAFQAILYQKSLGFGVLQGMFDSCKNFGYVSLALRF